MPQPLTAASLRGYASIFDGRATLPSAPPAYDIAGPAGIALAHELDGSGLRVALLESGGEAFDPETQALYDGEVTGLQTVDLTATRLRFLGGSPAPASTGRRASPTATRSWPPRSGSGASAAPRASAGWSSRTISTSGMATRSPAGTSSAPLACPPCPPPAWSTPIAASTARRTSRSPAARSCPPAAAPIPRSRSSPSPFASPTT